MSKLLIHEPPLQVLPSLAKAIGLNEAIIIQQLHYWLENPSSGKEQNGHKWIFNTYEEWHNQFPFWSISTIQRIFTSLEKSNFIISEKLNKKGHDMTKFYRVNYDELRNMEDVKMESSSISNKHDVNRNTETTTKKKINLEDAKKRKAKQRAERGDDSFGKWLELQDPEKVAELETARTLFDRIESAFSLSITGGQRERKEWQEVIRYLARQEEEQGWTIEKYAEWVRENKFDAPTKKQMANQPWMIQNTFPSAFEVEEAEETHQLL